MCVFFFQAEDGIRDYKVTGVQTCALPISGAAELTALTSHGFTRPRFGGASVLSRTEVTCDQRSYGSSSNASAGERDRSEERRVGEEGRSRGAPDHLKKKKTNNEGQTTDSR